MSLRTILTRTGLVVCTVTPVAAVSPLPLMGALSRPVESFDLTAPVLDQITIAIPDLTRTFRFAKSTETSPFHVTGTIEVAQLRFDRDKDKDDDQPARVPGSTATPTFKSGSPDEAIYKFCQALADDDTATASDYVSPVAKGLLGQMRDGDLSEEKIEELVKFMNPFTELEPVKRGQTMAKRILENKKGQVMTFLLKKDKDQEIYRITEISITKSKR